MPGAVRHLRATLPLLYHWFSSLCRTRNPLTPARTCRVESRRVESLLLVSD